MIVGRDKEIAALDATFLGAAAGQAAVVVIRGPVASGKTAMLHLLASKVSRGGALFLSAAAARTERGLPLGILCQLFGDKRLPADLSRRAADLVGSAAEALAEPAGAELAGAELAGAELAGAELAGAELAGIVVSPVAMRAFGGLVALLCELAEERPVVLAIDDIQYADLASMRWLSFLTRRARTAPILTVLTECAYTLPADRLLHAEILRQGNCHCVCLGPLTRTDVAGLLGKHLPAFAAERLASPCHAITGGNPLLVDALGQDARGADEVTPSQLEPDTAFSAAVDECLHRHEPQTVRLAQGVAVLGEDATPDLLSQMLQITPEAVCRGIAALDGSGLLESGKFRHETGRGTVLDRMAVDDRAVLHSRAAWALYRNGAAPDILARHLAASGQVPVDWAIPVLQEAAEKELAAGRVDAAIDYLTCAESRCGDRRQLVAIRFALARARWCTDPERAARHLPGLITDAVAGHLGSEHLAELASYLLWRGDAADAGRVLAAAYLTLSGPCPDEDVFGDHRITLLSCLDDLYPGLGRPRADGSARRGPAGGDPGDAELTLHERLNDPAHASAIAALLALICDDRCDRAASWCHVLEQGSDGSASVFREAVLSAARAMIEVREGNVTAGLEYARAALVSLPPKAWGVGIGWPISSLLLAAAAGPCQEEAAEFLRIPVPAAMFETRYGLLYLYGRGDYYLSTGRPHAALADYAECGRRMIAWQVDHPGLVPWRARAAEAYLALGDIARARELAKQQLALAGAGTPRSRGMALRVLGLCGDLGSRIALLRESADTLHEAGASLELAYTLTEMSSAYRALGEYGRAHASARQARALAERCGVCVPRSSAAASAAVRRGAGADGSAQTGPELIHQLSAAEQRVATLAAYGHTNAEIARELYITISTVEQHLTRVYRKLKISGRVDLAAAV